MRIAMVDDDVEFMGQVEEVVIRFGSSAGETVAVQRFEESSLLLKEIADKQKYDLYILDVEMPDPDGLELARKIREREMDANIVFLSNYEKYALPAYKVRAYDYIMKWEYENELPAVLDRVWEEKLKERQEGAYLIQTATKAKKLRFDEILYLIKEKKYVIFHCTDGQYYRERVALGDVYPKLPRERFIYINKGCIVNMKHVSGFKEDVISMDMGDVKHTVSQGRIQTVWKELTGYWEKMKW